MPALGGMCGNGGGGGAYKAVDIRRKAIKNLYNSYESTSGGRLELLKKMNLKNKIKKLKSLGVKVGKEDLKELDKLLIELWVEDD
jgi:hypothetical protein